MEAGKHFIRKIFGFQSASDKPSSDIKSRKRKHDSDESNVSKNSLNRPIKKARMAETVDENSKARVEIFSPRTWINLFSRAHSSGVEKKSKDKAEGSTAAESLPSLLDVERVSQVNLLENTTPDLQVDSQEILKNFSGFTAPEVDSTLSVSEERYRSPGKRGAFLAPAEPRHVIQTSYERQWRQQQFSPAAVRARLLQGSHASRARPAPHKYGKAVKKQKQNAFQWCGKLGERERYRQLLESFGVVKYDTLVKTKGSSSLLECHTWTGVGDLSKEHPKEDSQIRSKTPVPLASPTNPREGSLPSPILDRTRDSPSSVTPLVSRQAGSSTLPAPAVPRPDADRLDEVCSPAFLANLNNKYGAAARERDRQIRLAELRTQEAKKETESVYESISDRLNSYLKVTQAAVAEVKEESEWDESQPTEKPTLTAAMKEVIRNAVMSRGETLVDAHKIQITVKDIETLGGLNWLNDEIINFYMQMIVCRSQEQKQMRSVYAFTTFFYPRVVEQGHAGVKRWTKKVDIFSYSLLLIPVHLGMHWCLATVDMDKKAIVYYDSMGGDNRKCLAALDKYLKEEHKVKKGSPMDDSGWTRKIAKDIPQQMNGSDCGMFTCKFAEYISRRAKISFSQTDMPYFRQRMIYEIVSNILLHP